MERATGFQKPASRQIVRIRASWRSHGPARTAQPGGDRVLGVSLHPPDGDLPQGLVGQGVEQPAVLLGHDGGRLGGWLQAHGADHDVVLLGVVVARDVGSVADEPAAPLEPMTEAGLSEYLARGDQSQKPPEVVPVGQSGKLPPHCAGAEAVEGAQGRILLVAAHIAAAARAELLASQAHHPGEVALPELLRRRHVPSLQPADPARDRALVVTHPRPPSHVLRRCNQM